jgi:predicted GNAT family acetyltransferase
MSRLGLAAMLAAALTVPAAFGAQPEKAQPRKAAEPDKLLPADADSIVYLNLKQIVEADVIKKYALDQIKQALNGQDAKKLLEDMGLDPMKDIEKVWAGMSGSGPEDTKALVIVHGKFDPDKLFKAAEAVTKKDGDKFSMVKDGSATMFKYQPEQGNPMYCTVVDDATVVVGTDKKLVTAALKQAEEKKKAPIKAELTDLIKTLDEKSSMFAVALVKDKFANVKFPGGGMSPIDLSGLEKSLPKAETMSVVVKVTANIDLELVFGMKDEDAASDMDAAAAKLITDLAGFVPALVAFEPKAKPLADVVKTLKSEAKKKNVTLTGRISGDVIGKLIAPEG